MTFLARKPVLTIAATIFLAFSIWIFGNMQLGGFDMSALVDTGWRMVNGQKPYADFPLTTPVAFFIGADWAFQLFGVKWSSLVIAAIVFSALMFLAQTYLLSLIIPWKPALAISFVCQLLCSVVTSYWWYNSTTMGAACLFLTAAYVFASIPTERGSSAVLWAALTLLGFMKANIAGGLAILVFIPMILFLPHRRRILVIGLVAFTTFFLVLLLLKISPVDVVQSYLAIGKERAAPSIKWFFNDKRYEHLVVIPLMLLCLLPLLLSMFTTLKHQYSSKKRAFLGVTLASILMGALSIVTNSDSNLVVGIPFFLLGPSVFYYLMKTSWKQPTQNRIWTSMGIAFIVLVLAGNTVTQVNFHADNRPPNIFAFWYVAAIASEIVGILLLVIRDNPQQKFILPRNPIGERIVWALLLVCGGTAMFAGGMRWRVSYIGYESFFTYLPLTEVNEISFFKGFQISPYAKTAVLEIQDVLQNKYGNRRNWRDAPVYFGPRMEFAYAAFNILSPRNLPIWWHPKNSYSADHEQEYIRSFLNHEFEIAIFMKIPNHNQADFVFLPQSIVDNFLSNYKRVNHSSIVVFYKK